MRSEDHQKVEAVLFAVGKDIAVEEIARLCNLKEEHTQEILEFLKEEYTKNDTSSLTLHTKGKFWKFSVKDKFLPLVTSLVQHTELDKSVMETLAVIAWRYPILQADLIKIRHNKAYDHLKMLQEREFISKERSGRTYKIKLTPKFFHYFDLPTQDAKEAFRKVIPKEIQEGIEHAELEIEAREKAIAEKEKEPKVEERLDERTEEEKARDAAEQLDSQD